MDRTLTGLCNTAGAGAAVAPSRKAGPAGRTRPPSSTWTRASAEGAGTGGGATHAASPPAVQQQAETWREETTRGAPAFKNLHLEGPLK